MWAVCGANRLNLLPGTVRDHAAEKAPTTSERLIGIESAIHERDMLDDDIEGQHLSIDPGMQGIAFEEESRWTTSCTEVEHVLALRVGTGHDQARCRRLSRASAAARGLSSTGSPVSTAAGDAIENAECGGVHGPLRGCTDRERTPELDRVLVAIDRSYAATTGASVGPRVL